MFPFMFERSLVHIRMLIYKQSEKGGLVNAFLYNALLLACIPILIFPGQISGFDPCSRPLTLDSDTSDQGPLQGQQINTGVTAC